MVLLIIIPFLNGYFIGNINPTFSDKPICESEDDFPVEGAVVTSCDQRNLVAESGWDEPLVRPKWMPQLVV